MDKERKRHAEKFELYLAALRPKTKFQCLNTKTKFLFAWI
jgi:hypothetical protein